MQQPDDSASPAEFDAPRPGLMVSLGVMAGTAAMAVGYAALATLTFHDYGFTLFAGVPFLVGFVPALVPRATLPQAILSGLMLSAGALLLAAVGLLVFAVEGLICLVMLSPLALAGTVLGSVSGALLCGLALRAKTRLVAALAVALPLLMGAESLAPPASAVREVRTVLEIDAPPHVVWRHVVEFEELTEPPGFWFEKGIAYPVRARIEGRGVGAIRHCEFSTGAFVEPITVWEEPWLLRFDVVENPPAISEWNPFREVAAPHVDGYLVSEQGQFLLHALPGGRTRLEGTTWYRHDVKPGWYWSLWSDAIIHRIHGRVLRHIKGLAEGEVEAKAGKG